MTKKILILTASYWAWHNVAANTLNNFYKQKWYKTKVIDLVDFIDSFTGKTTQSFYQNFCSKYPKIWEKTFNILDNEKIKKILFSVSYPIYQKKFNKVIKDYVPDIVLSVFPFWGSFIKHNINKNWKKYETWIMITDSINIHSIWYLWWEYIDKYFLIDNYSKKEFIKKFNHKRNNLVVSFFPIEEKYFVNKKNINNKEIYILLTWLEEKYVITLLKHFKSTEYSFKIIKWRNKTLFEKLNKKYIYKNFKYLDYINLRENYKDIGIFIWKAWWATMSECIATDTPIIIPTFIPWQEEWNVYLIEKAELWIYENNPKKTIFLIKFLDWNMMLSNFKKIKNKKNCETVFNNLELSYN